MTVSVGTVAGRARLEVADTGSGIPPEEVPHIFEEFFRGQEAKKAVAHGTGLGMAIVKRVVQMHLGKIEVESQPGKGTRFIVMFPVAEGYETVSKPFHGAGQSCWTSNAGLRRMCAMGQAADINFGGGKPETLKETIIIRVGAKRMRGAAFLQPATRSGPGRRRCV